MAPATDPVVTEALEALSKRWTTYVNTFASTPVAVVRAMLLDALTQAATSDDRIGIAFVTSARNTLPFMEVGDEKAIWADVVAEIEAKVDARAEAEWATPESIALPPFSFEAPAAPAPKIVHATVNHDALTKRLQAAAGPQSANVQTNGNPHWPTANGPWVAEFGARASEAITEVVEGAAAAIRVSEIDIAGPLKELTTAVTNYVEGTLAAFSGATAGLQRRTGLLWWKEALYSPTARVSYRELKPDAAAALMAVDLHNQLPTFSPASVSAFLHEAVLLHPGIQKTESRSIGDLMETARHSPELAPLRRAAAALFLQPKGRGPLLALVAHSRTSLSASDFRDQVGIPSDTSLSMPAWATWLFREFQAARATAGKAQEAE